MEEKKMNISISPDKAAGTYSNLAIIAHSQNEFIMDFASVMPGIQQANVQSRIIMTPENAKQLMVALQQNIQKYESTFGEIVPRTGNRQPMNDGIMDFPLPKGQA